MSVTTCPVLQPTLEEFRNFRKYLSETITNYSSNGIIKVIPPEGWFVADYSKIDDIVFKPVKQRAAATEAGAYSLMIEDMPDMNVSTFRTYAEMNKSKENSAEARESQFWRELGKSQGDDGWGSRMYGADIANSSLFGKERACSWNLSNLDSTLRLIGCDVPGVSSSMLYIGMYSTLFPFHVEDCDLYSINYLHVGDPKSWYCVSPKERTRFESLARSKFPQDYLQCKEFLRHKTSIMSPSTLRANGIPFTKVVQNAGEFVITFPGSYHGGFNQGFNIAEATNFATASWISIGRRAGVCRCNPDAVSINMELFETLYLRSQNFLGKSPIGNPKSRKFRCACGATMSVNELGSWLWPPGVPSRRTFECAGCRCYAHVECIFDSNYKPKKNERLLCHVCHDLENKPPDRKRPRESSSSELAKAEMGVGKGKSSKGGKNTPRPAPPRPCDNDSDTDPGSSDDEKGSHANQKGRKKRVRKNSTGETASVDFDGNAEKYKSSSSSASARQSKTQPNATIKATIKKRVAPGDTVRARGIEGTVLWVESSECCVHPTGTSSHSGDIVVDFHNEEVATVRRA